MYKIILFNNNFKKKIIFYFDFFEYIMHIINLMLELLRNI